MRKVGYFLVGTILLSSLAMGQAEARQDGKYTFESKGNSAHDYDVKHKHGAKSQNKDSKYGGWSDRSRNVGRHITYDKPRAKQPTVKYKNIYKAPQRPKVRQKVYYVKPVSRPYYGDYYHYRYYPKYIYVKPYHAARYYGYYPYRGFYWPFVNVRFVVDLSPRQIEYHHQAVYSALDKPVGAVTRWREGVRSGSIVVLRDGFDVNGNLCKEYRQTLNYRGHISSSVEVSCLLPEGYWVSV